MSSEKTFQPTKKKIDDARKEGQVASSADFSRSLVALVLFETGRAFASDAGHWYSLFESAIDDVRRLSAGEEFQWLSSLQFVLLALAASGAVMGLAVAVWTLSSWLQTRGPVVLEKPLTLHLDKLDPSTYFKNVFTTKTLMTFGGNIAKSTLLFVIYGYALLDCAHTLLSKPETTLASTMAIWGLQLSHWIRISLWVMFLVSIFDVWAQMKMLIKNLMMSHQDMKDESKSMEGNPEIKQHIREIASEAAAGGASADPLAGSNALIVNPTHIAVGLYFPTTTGVLPAIRTKCVEHAATALIEHAQAEGVPVIRHLWLARTLYAHPVGRAVPREAYKAVAAIYRVISEARAGTHPADQMSQVKSA